MRTFGYPTEARVLPSVRRGGCTAAARKKELCMTRITLAFALVACLAAPASANKLVRAAIAGGGGFDPQPNISCHMSYGGGPLMQHVKVFVIFYSPNMPDRDKYAGFYTAITQSAHVDWLLEYNVTSYKIGRGSYIGMFEDTKPNPATVTSLTNPETYLTGLINNHKVPPPDDDTLYMMYFPSHVDPYLNFGGGSIPSCISNGQFCAYHSSFTLGTQLVRYGVMPDANAGGCAGGCGANPTPFQNMTDVSSHELIEAITDPDDNTAWVDSTQGCGEIGDICATGGLDEVDTVGGFTVQKEWSNKLNACIVTNPAVIVNDFSLAVAPPSVDVPVGGMASTMVSLSKLSGMAENVSLMATAATGGPVGSFSPASITSDGGKATLSIMASPAAMVGGTDTLTVTAKGTVASPAQKVTVHYTAPLDMTVVPDLAGDGDHGGGGCGCTVGGGRGRADTLGTGGLALALALALAGLGLRTRRRRAPVASRR
jgi:hypothetical protein